MQEKNEDCRYKMQDPKEDEIDKFSEYLYVHSLRSSPAAPLSHVPSSISLKRNINHFQTFVMNKSVVTSIPSIILQKYAKL